MKVYNANFRGFKGFILLVLIIVVLVAAAAFLFVAIAVGAAAFLIYYLLKRIFGSKTRIKQEEIYTPEYEVKNLDQIEEAEHKEIE